MFPQAGQSHILPGLTTVHLVGGGGLQLLDLGNLLGEGLELLLTVFLQDHAGLLEALVRQLLERHVLRGLDSGSTTPRTDWRGAPPHQAHFVPFSDGGVPIQLALGLGGLLGGVGGS